MRRGVFSLALAGIVAMALGLGIAQMGTAEAAPPGAAWNLRTTNVGPYSASFNWTSSGWGYQQWVDISHWNGYYWQWEHGGPLTGWDTSYNWGGGLKPNTTYYVRVNTGLWNGAWIGSDWVRFDTPGVVNCGPGYPYPYPYPYPQGQYQQQPGAYVVPGVAPCYPPNPNPALSINVDRGVGSTYYVGQQIRICYNVSQPGYIQIVDVLANGQQQTFFQGYATAGLNCQTGTVEPPKGLERVYIYANGASASTYFYVN